jgi:hypothetical protein
MAMNLKIPLTTEKQSENMKNIKVIKPSRKLEVKDFIYFVLTSS